MGKSYYACLRDSWETFMAYLLQIKSEIPGFNVFCVDAKIFEILWNKILEKKR